MNRGHGWRILRVVDSDRNLIQMDGGAVLEGQKPLCLVCGNAPADSGYLVGREREHPLHINAKCPDHAGMYTGAGCASIDHKCSQLLEPQLWQNEGPFQPEAAIVQCQTRRASR